MKRFIFISVLIILVSLAGLSLAGIPKMINYQGMLTDSSGNLLSGSYILTFKIYDDTTGGTLKWSETQTGVQVQNGLFNVILGKETALNLPFDQQYWLEVRVGAETLPRIRLTSVGYAYRAMVADSAAVTGSVGGWVDDGTVVRLKTSTDSVGIGTSVPTSNLHLAGSTVQIKLEDTDASAAASILVVQDKFGSGEHALQLGFPSGEGASRHVVFRINKQDLLTVRGNGNVGIGTTSPETRLDIKSSGSADGIRLTSSDDDDLFRARQNSDGSCGVIVYDSAGNPKVSIQGGTANSYFNAGNVGIGTTNPGAKLHVNGDLKVTDGAYYGNISSNSGSTGAPFPRWAYDSGWQTINPSQDILLTHNIGGNADDYVVDLQFKDVGGSWGINNSRMGGDNWVTPDKGDGHSGAYWQHLTNTYIHVYRQVDDTEADQIRVRIWVYK
jgi:hypothetical protein